jgi:hypothetical protein
MIFSRKKNSKLRISKKNFKKGGNQYTLQELREMNQGYISININLLDENNIEILNLINKDQIYNIQNQIKDEISRLLETYLESNQNSISLDEDGEIKTLFTNWDVTIYLQTANKEFPFSCYLKFISALPLNSVHLDTVTKVITESDLGPIELVINNTTHEFKLISNYSNLGNRTLNYEVTKREWEDEREIECGFTNGLGSNPRSDLSCLTKRHCKKPTRLEQKQKIKTKYGRDDINCIPKYSKFNYDNELLARETDETTWKFNVDKLCSSKNYISCKIGKNGCQWDKVNDKCAVSSDGFIKRKEFNYY